MDTACKTPSRELESDLYFVCLFWGLHNCSPVEREQVVAEGSVSLSLQALIVENRDRLERERRSQPKHSGPLAWGSCPLVLAGKSGRRVTSFWRQRAKRAWAWWAKVILNFEKKRKAAAQWCLALTCCFACELEKVVWVAERQSVCICLVLHFWTSPNSVCPGGFHTHTGSLQCTFGDGRRRPQRTRRAKITNKYRPTSSITLFLCAQQSSRGCAPFAIYLRAGILLPLSLALSCCCCCCSCSCWNRKGKKLPEIDRDDRKREKESE